MHLLAIWQDNRYAATGGAVCGADNVRTNVPQDRTPASGGNPSASIHRNRFLAPAYSKMI